MKKRLLCLFIALQALLLLTACAGNESREVAETVRAELQELKSGGEELRAEIVYLQATDGVQTLALSGQSDSLGQLFDELESRYIWEETTVTPPLYTDPWAEDTMAYYVHIYAKGRESFLLYDGSDLVQLGDAVYRAVPTSEGSSIAEFAKKWIRETLDTNGSLAPSNNPPLTIDLVYTRDQEGKPLDVVAPVAISVEDRIGEVFLLLSDLHTHYVWEVVDADPEMPLYTDPWAEESLSYYVNVRTGERAGVSFYDGTELIFWHDADVSCIYRLTPKEGDTAAAELVKDWVLSRQED